MKLPKYKDVLKMSKDAVKDVLVPVRASRAKKQAELEMCKLDETIAVKQAELHEACTQEEVNFSEIIEMQDTIALNQRKKKQYQKILDEMFPDED